MVKSFYTVTDEELRQLSSQNSELCFERNADGTLITMPPTGGISGNRELKAGAYLLIWVENNDLGDVFSSSTGFKLKNGAVRSPDAAFVAKGRLPVNWDRGEDEFLNLAPDFAIEIRSKTDSLEKLKAKMQEYIANGVKLGWLIDRQNQQALVYRADGTITSYPATATLTGEEVVPGFQLALKLLL
ncbi:MAG: Uma2 family endonuclease [Oscillatoria sp. PMC 1068.18]|nr:Uma2 family endonuclease [Oscillatoria sp. PMC 1076.18]MEC4990910.1 Uma2 family endonuclease [Oscillatoria sp. PMC 1068.18]